MLFVIIFHLFISVVYISTSVAWPLISTECKKKLKKLRDLDLSLNIFNSPTFVQLENSSLHIRQIKVANMSSTEQK